MTPEELQSLCIAPDASLRETMARIDANASGIVLIVGEDERLLGTATDGDVRRGILRGIALEAPVREIMNLTPKTASPTTPRETIAAIFRQGHIRTVPVLDSDSKLIDAHDLRDWIDEGWTPGDEQAPGEENLHAILMAGGLGSRLRPLTNNTPKPLLPVGGKPILEHTIEHLRSSGVDEVVITTRYLGEQIEDYFGNGDEWDVGIDYLREKERLGTAGALKLLEGQISRRFLVMNGDLMTDFNVGNMVSFHKEQNAALTMAVRHYSFKVPYGVASVEDVFVQRLIEKPTYDFFVNAGVYILEPWTIDYIPEGTYFDITELIDALLADGHPVVSWPLVEAWMDIGRPEDLERARAMLASPPSDDPR